MAKWVFLNNGFVEEEKALLHFRDLSFQRGYGVFDFFRLIEAEPLFLDDHLSRFYFSASEMRLLVTLKQNEIKDVIRQLIHKNGVPNTGIRISLTGGYSDDGFSLGKPALILSQHSFSLPEGKQNGIRLMSYPFQRQLSHVKTIDYLNAIWLQPLIKQTSADDVLYHNNGFITECPRSNFFLVTANGHIATPPENVLKGVTRKKVIELARREFTVEERSIHLQELATAQEAFITSTTKRLLPVAAIDKKVFTEQKISRQLLQRFNDLLGV